jgi:hypothetical protein
MSIKIRDVDRLDHEVLVSFDDGVTALLTQSSCTSRSTSGFKYALRPIPGRHFPETGKVRSASRRTMSRKESSSD